MGQVGVYPTYLTKYLLTCAYLTIYLRKYLLLGAIKGLRRIPTIPTYAPEGYLGIGWIDR